MATNSSSSRVAEFMKCSICSGTLKKPRICSCGHSFCSLCLETKLNSAAETGFLSSDPSNSSLIKFKCPRLECSREFTFPDSSIENFTPCIDLEKLIEAEQIRNSESVCSKPSEVCSLFCMDCKRELCSQCLDRHDGHKFRNKSRAIQFYVEKFQEKEVLIQGKYKEIKEKIEEAEKLCENSETKTSVNIENTLNLFIWTATEIREQEVSCFTRILQEQEFSSPSRKKKELEKRSRGLQYANQIMRPIISSPGKTVTEPVLVLELAEHTLNRADADQDTPTQNIQIQMKKPLSESKDVGEMYLDSLKDALQYENYSMSLKVPHLSAGTALVSVRSTFTSRFTSSHLGLFLYGNLDFLEFINET